MDIKTVHQPPYSPDLAPCDFCLFPKLRGCRHYEAVEEMKGIVQWTKALVRSRDIPQKKKSSIPGEGSGGLSEGKLTGDN